MHHCFHIRSFWVRGGLTKKSEGRAFWGANYRGERERERGRIRFKPVRERERERELAFGLSLQEGGKRWLGGYPRLSQNIPRHIWESPAISCKIHTSIRMDYWDSGLFCAGPSPKHPRKSTERTSFRSLYRHEHLWPSCWVKQMSDCLDHLNEGTIFLNCQRRD